jgi:8-oxo-dGTP pyrophosphatase MutT (NUDIX family)
VGEGNVSSCAKPARRSEGFQVTFSFLTHLSSSLSCLSYGTVIYLPQSPVVDFGESAYPSPYEKKVVCPRVLLVSTWTDGKYGFPGGGVKKNEDIVSSMNREFLEEIGTNVEFSSDDFCFSVETDGRISYHFAKITNDESYFNSLLTSFHSADRKAYVDEIIGIAGFPVWVEGPIDPASYCWNNNIWGLPRHLCFQGGSLTPTLQTSYFPRESLIILLLMKGIVSYPLMRRVFGLAAALCQSHPENCVPLEEFDAFLTRVGILINESEEEPLQEEGKESKKRKTTY